MSNVETVSVRILDKEYQVNCKPEEVSALRRSASYLDDKMREIKSSASVLGLDRIAVMAALNIANDYLSQSEQASGQVATQKADLNTLSSKLDQALTRLKSVTN